MENPIKMDDLGKHPYFWKHPYELDNINPQYITNGWIMRSPDEVW